MTDARLGDLFYACYYARDPVMLKELSDKADALEKELEAAKKTIKAVVETQKILSGE